MELSQEPAGIVYFGAKRFKARNFPVAPFLRPFLLNYWDMSWDLPSGESFSTKVIPSGCVNLLLQNGCSRVVGLRREIFEFVLQGKGYIFGALFKPGGFYPFFRRPVSVFTDGALPVDVVFGEVGTQLEEKLLHATSEPERPALLDRFFLERLPRLDESLATVSRIVDRIQNEGNITQVADLVKATGLGTRALQRLFDKHVGVSPKWLIRTVRFQTAVKALEGGDRFDWADFALSLGYYDQSHFINDFRSIVGESPDTLTGRLRTDFSP